MGLHVYQILLIHKSLIGVNKDDLALQITPPNDSRDTHSESIGPAMKILQPTLGAEVSEEFEENESQSILENDSLRARFQRSEM